LASVCVCVCVCVFGWFFAWIRSLNSATDERKDPVPSQKQCGVVLDHMESKGSQSLNTKLGWNICEVLLHSSSSRSNQHPIRQRVWCHYKNRNFSSKTVEDCSQEKL
jgi:hypothetical protein